MAKLTLPGDFKPGTVCLWLGETVNAWRNALLRDRAIAGNGIKESQGPDGRIFSIAAPVNPPAAFYTTYLATIAGTDYLMIQGGEISSTADTNLVLADFAIATVGSEPADGSYTWLAITGDGNAPSDGRIYGGFSVTSAAVGSGLSFPANSSPVPGDASGKVYNLLLGMWSGAVFTPSSPYNVNIGFCPPGGYNIFRF